MITAEEALKLSDSTFKWLEYEETQLNLLHLRITGECKKGNHLLCTTIKPCAGYSNKDILENIATALRKRGYSVRYSFDLLFTGKYGNISIYWDSESVEKMKMKGESNGS